MTSVVRRLHQHRHTIVKHLELAFATDMDRTMVAAQRLKKQARRELVMGELDIAEFRAIQHRINQAVITRNYALHKAYFGEKK